MKVLEEIIKVERAAWEHTDGTLRVAATLASRRDSTVYAGHFPGNPITPGVCMIGAVVELLSQATGHTLRLAKVNNTKTTTATFTKGDTIYAKMKLTLRNS